MTKEEKSTALIIAPDTEFIGLLREMAVDPSVDPAKMQAILDVQERMMKKRAEQAFDEAMLRIDQELPRLVKNTPVEYEKVKGDPKSKYTAFKYIKYEDVDANLRPLMKREGLRISFTSVPRIGDGGGTMVTAKLTHRFGHFIEASMSVALDNSGGKSNLQGMGSSIAYARRVLTCMLFNIVTVGEDKDGVRDVEYINTEKAVEIDQRLRSLSDHDVYRPKFMAYMKVDNVDKIIETDFLKACNALDAKEKASKK
ncbi:MAG: ERF family protein [Patescibacteria group bacterium]|nr:ERF family protein [Patescibacteria group bacterium]